MLRSFRPALWLLCLTMPACTSVSSLNDPVASPSAGSAKPSVAQAQPTGAIAPPPASLIRIEPLSLTSIRIEPGQLPAPYATSSASKSPQVIAVPANPTLKVPVGFTVNVFAEGLDAPRWLALTPTGDILVTETRQNRIRLLGDRNQDGVAELNQTFATANNGLNIPFGMTFAGDAFFVGNSASVLRFPYRPGQLALTGQGQKIADLPGGGYNQHWTRNVVAAPDGTSLYVSIGSRSNADEEPLPRASIQVMNLNGSTQKTFAAGLRNPVGLDFHFRGSWNRDQGTGYKIVYVPFGADHRPVGTYEEFVTGFLVDPSRPTTWGRPVGMLVLPDGSLLLTEEANGRIYRVQYQVQYQG